MPDVQRSVGSMAHAGRDLTVPSGVNATVDKKSQAVQRESVLRKTNARVRKPSIGCDWP